MAEELIVADAHILDGKPCVRGTRLSVEFLSNWPPAGPRLAGPRAVSSAHGGGPLRGVPLCRQRVAWRMDVGPAGHRVKVVDFPLLADEDFAREVVSRLRVCEPDVQCCSVT